VHDNEGGRRHRPKQQAGPEIGGIEIGDALRQAARGG